MTGAVAVAAVVGLLSLLAGVALGSYLRRPDNRCPTCGDHLTCAGCARARSATPSARQGPGTLSR